MKTPIGVTMKPKTSNIKPKALTVLAALIAVWSLWFFRPEHQLERAHRRLIHAVESRNWDKLRKLTTDDFAAGIYDKDESIEIGQHVLGPFFSIQITEDGQTTLWERPQCVITSQIRMAGKGVGFTDMVVSTVNAQTEPFVFTWQRMGWKPWGWRLARVEHPLLTEQPPLIN